MTSEFGLYFKNLNFLNLYYCKSCLVAVSFDVAFFLFYVILSFQLLFQDCFSFFCFFCCLATECHSLSVSLERYELSMKIWSKFPMVGSNVSSSRSGTRFSPIYFDENWLCELYLDFTFKQFSFFVSPSELWFCGDIAGKRFGLTMFSCWIIVDVK